MLEKIDSEEGAREVMNHYYQLGDRSKLVEAMKYIFHLQIPEENKDILLYFFLRAATIDPEIVQCYERMLCTVPIGMRPLLQTIIQIAKGEETSKLPLPNDPKFPYQFDVVGNPVTRLIDLDYLWCEFFLTGNSAAVEKIMEAFSGVDLFRVRLNNWLIEPREGFFQKRQRRKALNMLREVGVEVDNDVNNIKNQDDLDCLIIFGRNTQYSIDPERLPEILSALPFELSDEDINHMMIKAAAQRSLIHNGIDNLDVKAIYMANVATLPTRVHIPFDDFGNIKLQGEAGQLESGGEDKEKLVETYGSLSEGELLELYAERDELTPAAYEVLEIELRKRFPEGVTIKY
jgi:hypothetical protein